MSTETELKLHIRPQDAEKLVQHPLLQTAFHTHPPQHLYSTYFDTQEHMLLQQGVGLRVRRMGDKRVQTLKTAGSGLGGLHQRQEWEIEITGDTPQYDQFPAGTLPQWCADPSNLAQIKPLFVTDFMRTTWHLVLNKSEIEVALDQGEVKTSTATHPLSEVELELKSGSPDQLYKVALTLQDALPLSIENKSKAAKGYALHKPQPLKFRKAGAVKLKAEMTTEQAFVHIIWHCLGHLQANEDMVLQGEDIEGVHQMRVALRRLRSCLAIYKPLIPNKIYDHLLTEIKWITESLGVARDWDVFALSLRNMQNPLTTEEGEAPLKKKGVMGDFSAMTEQKLDKLQIRVANKKATAYVAVRDALCSPRYTRLLLRLGKWLMQRRWRRELDVISVQRLESPITDFASQVLDLHSQRVIRQGANLLELDAESLHKLRISIKKLAYSARFFAELYPRETARPYVKTLSHLQDELGILNDGNVATHLLNQIGLGKKARIRHFLNGWYAHQQATHLASLEAAWQTFLGQRVFWTF